MCNSNVIINSICLFELKKRDQVPVTADKIVALYDIEELPRERDVEASVRVETGVETLLDSYISIYRMVKTIRVSEEYHEWLAAHKTDEETMEETLRRMTRGPNPSDVAGLLTDEEAEGVKESVGRLRERDRGRLDAARTAFENEDESQ